jgi:hypothetical protein
MDGYHLLDDTEHAFHVGLPSGESMMIAKKGLHQSALDKIGALPGANPDPSLMNTNLAQDLQDPASSGGGNGAPSEEDSQIKWNTSPMEKRWVGDPAAQPGQPQPAQPQAVPQDPPPTQDPGFYQRQAQGLVDPMLKDQTQAIQDMSKAGKTYYKNAAGLYGRQAEEVQDYHEMQQKIRGEAIEGMDENIKAYSEGKLNPNQVFAEMGTGSKISTMAGLFLGTLGSSISGTPNYAYAMFQKAIDRDMEAQKENRDQKRTLYQMNLQKYGNSLDAERMTKATLEGITLAQIQRQGAMYEGKLQDPKAQMLISQLKQSMMNNVNSVSGRLATAKMYGAMGTPAGLKDEHVPPELRKDPEFHQKNVNVNGTWYPLNDPKDREKIVAYQEMMDGTLKDLQDLKNLHSKGESGLNPWNETSQKGEGVRAKLMAKLNKIQPLTNSLTHGDIEIFKKEMPLPGALTTRTKAAQEQIDRMIDTLKSDYADTFKTRLTGVPKDFKYQEGGGNTKGGPIGSPSRKK